jgi:YidC/Oxa1 family membrane protein insertase
MLKAILVNPLINALLLIYALLPGHDFGVAVILLTVLIRILLWPLVRKQLYHQKAMKELQPEIAKIKKKAGGDRTKESQMMVELFKEKEINPFGSLGLALLQFPVLIALYFVLRHVLDPQSISNSVYPFVANLAPVKAILSDPSSFHPTLFGVVDMAKPSIVLAILAGAAQFIQTRQLAPTNPSGGGTAAALTANMTLLFPLLTVIIAIKFPAALALYWFVSSVIAIIQQHIVLAEDVSFMESLLPPKKAKKKS